MASVIAGAFDGAEAAGDGQWTARCPICAGKVVVLPHHPTASIGVSCLQGCSRDDVLESAGLDPSLAAIYRPDTKLIRTPLHFLKHTGDTPENRLATLDGFFPAAQDDALWSDPEFRAFLKLGCDDSDFYSELLRRMGAQFWRRDAVDNFLTALGITNPMLNANPLAETFAPIIVNLADVQPLAVQWTWWPYLARGMIAVLDGDPGIGKSLLTVQLAASLSRGFPLPDQQGKPTLPTSPSTVLFLAGEDSVPHTIRPRLDRAGADPSRIHILTGFVGREAEEKAFTLQHMPVLRRAMADLKPALVLLDPLQSYMGAANMNYATETRPLMTALGRTAEEFDATILCVRHLAKPAAGGGGKALHRGLGSIDIIGAARTALLVESHPVDRDKALLMMTKSNIGPKGRVQIFNKADGAFAWSGVSRLDAEVIAGNGRGPDPLSLLEAAFWLERKLSGGIPVPSTDIIEMLAEEGFKGTTVKAAKKSLGIISLKTGDTWSWKLPSLEIISPPSLNTTPPTTSTTPTTPTTPTTTSSINSVIYEDVLEEVGKVQEGEEDQEGVVGGVVVEHPAAKRADRDAEICAFCGASMTATDASLSRWECPRCGLLSWIESF
jgi:ribosomal protein S27AE